MQTIIIHAEHWSSKKQLSVLTAITDVVLWPHKNTVPTCYLAKLPSWWKVLYETIKNKYNQIRTQELPPWVVQYSWSSVICCQHNLSRRGRAWLSFRNCMACPVLYPKVQTLFFIGSLVECILQTFQHYFVARNGSAFRKTIQILSKSTYIFFRLFSC